MAISRTLLSEGERVVVSTRTHPKALLLPVLALVLLLAVGTFVETRVDDDQRLLAWIVWGAVALGVLWLFVWPLLTWLVGHYTITDRRIITRTGVLTRRGHDIPLSRISDVQVERHLSDRLLGCGTLVIGDASPDGAVALPDIPRVREAQARLNDLLHALHSRGGRHDEGA
ncbi:PH domain-containing protein [uncultured Nocardioides sp.]|uniref:PH domain-containing protein n=1 Tax=uncultured Nocardioides sp. TaxID=198441 RepID=UPI00260DB654|nr:PH domain-containing protein [uncultured Nocardioides sp.]